MRTKLRQLGGQQRYQFTGTFKRTGFKNTYHGQSHPIYQPTLLLVDLWCEDQFMTDHLWLNYGKNFLSLGELQPGDQVTFKARVARYEKGHFEHRQLDYHLTRPTQVRCLTVKQPREQLPINDKNALIGYIMRQNRDFYLANHRPVDDWYLSQYRNWQNHVHGN